MAVDYWFVVVTIMQRDSSPQSRNSACHKHCAVFANKTSDTHLIEHSKKKSLIVSKETHIDHTFPPKTAECSMAYKFCEPLFQAIGKPTRRVAVRHCRPSAIAAAAGGLLAAAN